LQRFALQLSFNYVERLRRTQTNLERKSEGVWEKAVSFNQDTSSDGEPYSSYNRSRR